MVTPVTGGTSGTPVLQTPPRGGEGIVYAVPRQAPMRPQETGGETTRKTTPSDRRGDQSAIPAILRVAGGATARIVDPSVVSEADFEQLMAVPSYIYCEEHYPAE